jgi:uncharacterized protein RhaS with RHS repeats
MRDYDPTTGRYLQADSLGLVDGASVYGYVGQSPMRFTDPTGQFIPQAAAAAALCAVNPVCAGGVIFVGAAWYWYANYYCPDDWNFDFHLPPWLSNASDDGKGDDPAGDDNGPPPDPPFDYPHGWDGTTPPAHGWKWGGTGAPGSGEGSWYDPATGKSVRPDFNHGPGIPPHIDYNDRESGKKYRWFPDGTMDKKKPR